MPKANRILERILAENKDWLHGRARGLSRQLYGHPEEVDEIAAEAILLALELLHRGWMEERPRVNFTAHARHLLNICLMRVRDRHLTMSVQTLVKGVEPSDLEYELPSSTESAEISVIRKQSSDELLAAIATLSPSRRLAVLALHLPEQVSEEVVLAAAVFRRGGGGLSRSGEETWRLFQAAFRERYPAATDAAWRRIVAEILRGTGPLGSTPRPRLDRAVNTLEVQVSNAVRQLLDLLSQGEET